MNRSDDASRPPGHERRTRAPSPLGRALAFGLLGALLLWRLAVPAPPAWLDALALLFVAGVLWAVRALLPGTRSRPRNEGR